MTFRAHLGTALVLAALGLAPGAAHVMEMPVKMAYPPDLYAAVTSSLYAWYGIAGGSSQVAAAVATGLLAVRSRGSAVGGLFLASTAAMATSLLLWATLVAPVNARWADVAHAGQANDVVSAYEMLRARWEYGHLAAFIAWLTGLLGLVAAAMRHVSGAPPRGAS